MCVIWIIVLGNFNNSLYLKRKKILIIICLNTSNVSRWSNDEELHLIKQNIYVSILSIDTTTMCSYASFFDHARMFSQTIIKCMYIPKLLLHVIANIVSPVTHPHAYHVKHIMHVDALFYTQLHTFVKLRT
jgi:hypothetical protein